MEKERWEQYPIPDEIEGYKRLFGQEKRFVQVFLTEKKEKVAQVRVYYYRLSQQVVLAYMKQQGEEILLDEEDLYISKEMLKSILSWLRNQEASETWQGSLDKYINKLPSASEQEKALAAILTEPRRQ